MSQRRRFQRPLGERRYRKLFVIAVEGGLTETQYFSVFNKETSVVRVRCLKGKDKSSPPNVLQRMEDYLKKEALKHSDEAWLVVDKDQWSDEQLMELWVWSQKAENYGFALSNPKFEYWLLLHFEDRAGIASSRDCSARLNLETAIDRLLPIETFYFFERHSGLTLHQMSDHATRPIARFAGCLALLLRLAWNSHAALSRLARQPAKRTLGYVQSPFLG